MRTQSDKFKKLDPGSTHAHVLAGMKASRLDPGSSRIHVLARMKASRLDPRSSRIHVLAGMKPSWLHFSASIAALAVAALLAGCAQLPQRIPARPATPQPLARMDVPVDPAASRAAALVIRAGFALQDDDTVAAAMDYADAAGLADDPAITQRALQLALATRNAGTSRTLLARWEHQGARPRDLAGARAQLALLDGDRTVAVKQFKILLAAGDAGDWKTFARDLLAAPDPSLAGQVLEDVATPAQLPANEAIWIALSQLGEHLGRHAFASRMAQAAVRRFDGVDSIRWAASLRLSGGDPAAAEALYAQGVAAHPRNVDLRLGYAALLGEQRKYAKALAILARGPQTSATWGARVAVAARAGDAAALRQLYEDLQRASAAGREDNAFLLGQLAELLHHDRQALAWYAKVDPDSRHGFDAQVRSAVLLDKAGHRARAQALAVELQHDQADDPDNLRAAYELGAQLYAQHGEHARAIAVYDRALAALPGDPGLLYDRGIEEADAGDVDAALADFHKVLALSPDNVEAMNALGFTLADADRNLTEATGLLRKALAAEPDEPAIMDSWGWLQYRLGNLDQAEVYLRRAWGKQRDPDIGVHLAQVLWKLGQHQQAREMFARVHRLDPGNPALRHAEQALHP